MANNTVDLKFVADSTPIVQANKRLDTMGRTLEGLIKKQNEGAISDKQFAKAKKELRRSVDDLYPSWNRAKSAIDNLEKSIKSNNATLTVEKEALRKAKEETQSYARARREAEEANRRFDAELKKAERQLKASATSAQEYYAKVYKLDQVQKSAAQSASVFEKDLKEQAQAFHRLKMATDASYASTQRLQDAKRVLKREVRENGMTVEQYVEAMRKVVQANNAASASAGQMGRRMSRNGVMVQQAGYQIGDFIVQVQSGQNPMVAFGQQATQMAGTLTMLGGRMVAIGTGLGIAIPLVTAFGAAWMRAKGESDEASKSLKSLDDRVKSLRASLADFQFDQKSSILGLEPDEFALNLALERSKTELKEIESTLNSISVKSVSQALVDSIPLVGSLFGSEAKIQEAESEVTKLLLDISTLESKIAENRRKKAEEFEAKRKSSQEDFLSGLMQESNFWSAMYGKNQDQIDDLNEKRDLHNKLLELGLKPSDSLYLNALKYAEQIKVGKETTENLARAIEDASSSFETLLGQSSDIDVEIAKVVAQIDAVKKGSDVATAAYIAGERAKVSATAETTKALALQTNNLALLAETAIAYAEAMTKLDNLESLKLQLSEIKPSRGGGGSSEKQDPLAKLRERIKLDTELLDKTKERQEVERAIANSKKTYSKDAIDQAVAELTAYNQIVEKRQELQGIYDTAQSAFEDGFMAMVEGTKSVEDAFKDMARSIIKELYDVLVVQRMVGTFNAGSGGGTGIMGFLGSVFGKASGGTVQTNQPYLVGEKGPEIIVPRNRGHVMNADLTSNAMGGGGDVYVTNNFTMSANGDDSVKKIIAQSMPAIVNASKQGVMDARRRGGAMKNTFG